MSGRIRGPVLDDDYTLFEATLEMQEVWALRNVTRAAIALARRLSAENRTLKNHLALLGAELERYGYETDS